MSKEEQDEKEEKQRGKDEKDLQKQEEKSAEEKYRRDRLGALVWALILIWAGVVFLFGSFGTFDLLTDFVESLPFRTTDWPIEIVPVETWTIFFLGAAIILLAEIVVRLLMPQYRKPVFGTGILAVVFLGLAFGSWECILPLILIMVGLSILWRNFSKKE